MKKANVTRRKWKPKGDYVICLEDDGTLYSTDSYFWYMFFTKGNEPWYQKENREWIERVEKLKKEEEK